MNNNIEKFDLLGTTCREFTVDTADNVVSVSRDADQQILTLMRKVPHTNHDDPKGLSVNFASLNNIEDGATVVFTGLLARFQGDDGAGHFAVHIDVSSLDYNPGPPPTDFRPFGELLKITGGLLGEVSVDCTGVFIYNLDESIGSQVQLPVPLLLGGQNSEYGVTHIEAVVLGRRTKEGLAHMVQVDYNDDDQSIVHTVRFGAKGFINLEGLQNIRKITEELSRTLLVQREEDT